MNNQFRNSNFGSILYISIIVMVALGMIIITWYMLVGFRTGTFAEDTILGSVYMGGVPKEELEQRVYDRIEDWKEDETVVFELTYQGYTYEFDRELFFFDIPLSKSYLQEGETNDLIVYYQDTGTDRQDTINEIKSLPFLIDVKENINYDDLLADIMDDAGLLKTYSSKAIESYLVDPDLNVEELGSVEFHIPEGFTVDLMIESIQAIYGDEYIDVNSKELFDVVESLSNELSGTEMNILSSAMLKLIWSTNFSIHEVHYDPLIPAGYDLETYPDFGSNAEIDTGVGYSFSFYNPNDSKYSFKVEAVNENSARLTLLGLPFVNTITYEVVESDIPYITQTTDYDDDIQTGREGKIVIIHRVITDINENIINEKDIIFEFYPPKVEIVLESVPE